MRYLLFTLMALMAFLFFACPNAYPPSSTARPPLSADTASVLPPVDANDLLYVLEGRWRNEQDPARELDISGSTMRALTNQQVTQVSDIEVDAPCQSVACATGQGTSLTGWCFQLRSESVMRCCLVSQCDSLTLQFRVLGEDTQPQTFKRVDQTR